MHSIMPSAPGGLILRPYLSRTNTVTLILWPHPMVVFLMVILTVIPGGTKWVNNKIFQIPHVNSYWENNTFLGDLSNYSEHFKWGSFHSLLFTSASTPMAASSFAASRQKPTGREWDTIVTCFPGEESIQHNFTETSFVQCNFPGHNKLE